MTVLYQVECKGCGLEFFVPPAHQGVTLCRSCEALKELLATKSWEKPVGYPFWKGVLYAFLFCAPIWFLFYFLVIR